MTSSTASLSTTQRRILWGVRIFLAVAFAAAGAAKLAGVPEMIKTFEGVGVGQWFRYVTGLIEVSSAVMLLLAGYGLFAALILTATMIGAVITHLFLIGGSALPAVVLGVLAGYVAWRMRPVRVAAASV